MLQYYPIPLTFFPCLKKCPKYVAKNVRPVIFFNVSQREVIRSSRCWQSFGTARGIHDMTIQSGIPTRHGEEHVTMEDIMPKPMETVDGLQRFDRGLPQAEEK